MTLIEKQMHSIEKEIENLQIRLAKAEDRQSKKIAKCEKLNCNWSVEEFRSMKSTDMTDKQWDAMWSKLMCQHDVEDIQSSIENAQKRLQKATEKFIPVAENEEFKEKVNKVEAHWLTAEERKAEYEKWLAEFKAECLKDGVVIKEADSTEVSGLTKSGKNFFCYINNGYSKRSFYCYTLRIEGETIFTSGTFQTCYSVIAR